MNQRASLVVFVACLLACGCEKKNTFCQAHLNDPECPDAGVDGPLACTGNAQCSGPTPVCDLAVTMACVQCTETQAQACTGTTPACVANTCAVCTLHSQCASGACLPDGACGAETAVAYVDPGGTDNANCTKAAPCTKVAKALATGRAYVKFHGVSSEPVTINNQNVTLLADTGAQLTSSAAGVILRVDGTSTVTIKDLEVINGLGATGIGISMPAGNAATLTLVSAKVTNNAGGGISATGGTLTISRSTISNNAGGGISLSGTTFDVQNSVIAKNGGGSTVFGGVLINQLGSGAHTIAFNTIANNVGQAGFTTGITCQLVASPTTFSNNIVFGNTSTQVAGTNCSHTYSDIGPDMATGTGNINAAPMFVNPTQDNFHIMTSSPAKDAADPTSTLAVDIDGDARPKGAARDIGADEAL